MNGEAGATTHSSDVNPSRAWVRGEAPELEEDVNGNLIAVRSGKPDLVPSPFIPLGIGTATETRQRVLKICLGAEHGILLTDAGIVCTWGDNRYGQLGRRPRFKEEDGQPFPILHLQNEEVSQIAAGRHHCLALAANGLVWAWGRNKSGQLGIGDTRDKVIPEKVCLAPREEETPVPLGFGGLKSPHSIITIAAGGNSSVAAALNGDVWQWGKISDEWKEHDQGAKQKKGARNEAPEQPWVANRPYKVFQKENYRQGLRPEAPVSITEYGCRCVFGSEDKSKLKDLVESARQLQVSIVRERNEIAQLEAEQALEQQKKNKMYGEADGSEQRSLQETLTSLELQINGIEHDIDLLTKNLQNCELQQEQNQAQMQNLVAQGTQLSMKQDQLAVQVFDAHKGTAQRKQLEDQLAEIKDFVEANQNTRMTLLDQRQEGDQHKQRLQHELHRCQDLRNEMRKRLETVRGLGESAFRSLSASDKAMEFLKEEKARINTHFDRKPTPGLLFLEAKKEIEQDQRFLDEIEQKLKVTVEVANDKSRAKKIQRLLQDIVDLRKIWSDMIADRWLADDLDLSSFLKKPTDEPAAETGAPG
eukprot:TRINITY_DN13948_c0_g1_i1.p1 TRINITY_DN13948_c0_g1~~TRINITY_DN13948_c0_g1_i1.p1  ORF type:complete len:589 (+),score=118.08 TRINITY_DN13948_c0_g1_i1:326-2092(+)